MACTRRIREGINAIREAASSRLFRFSYIFKAIVRSQTVKDINQGVARIPEAKTTLHSLFIATNEKLDEAQAIVKTSIANNMLYYLVPAITCYTTRYLLESAFDNKESGLDGYLDYLIVNIPLGYVMLRRLVDNSLYLASLIRSRSDEIDREKAKQQFEEFLPYLVRTLTQVFCRKSMAEEFYTVAYEELYNSILNLLLSPDSFRKNFEITLENTVHHSLTFILAHPSSYFSPKSISQPLAKVISTVICRAVNKGSAVDEKKLTAELQRIFQAIKSPYDASQFAQDIINAMVYSNAEVKKKQKKNKISSAARLAGLLRNPLEYISYVAFIALVGKYMPAGNYLKFILNAELFGRGLLELKLSSLSFDERRAILSSNKALSFGLGMPFSLVVSLVPQFFIRDALLNVMMPLWTLAELKDDNQIVKSGRNTDHFMIPHLVAEGISILTNLIIDFVNWFNIILKKHIPNLKPRITMDQIAALIKNILISPQFSWAMAIALGDHNKLPKITLADNWHEILGNQGLTLDVLKVEPDKNSLSTTPDAVDILTQIPSINTYLKFYGPDISSQISVINKLRVFKPWLASPLLVLFAPNKLIPFLTLALHLLKDEDLDQIFKRMNAKIQNLQMEPKKIGEESTLVLIPAPPPTAAAPVKAQLCVDADLNYFTIEKKSTEVKEPARIQLEIDADKDYFTVDKKRENVKSSVSSTTKLVKSPNQPFQDKLAEIKNSGSKIGFWSGRPKLTHVKSATSVPRI